MSALSSKTVLVTRPLPQADAFARRLHELGATPLVLPSIEITDVTGADADALNAARDTLPNADFAMFVSAAAVTHALRNLRFPPHLLALSTGKGTSDALRRMGVPDAQIVQPDARFDSEGLLELPVLAAPEGKKLLIFRGQDGRPVFGDAMKQRGADVQFVTAYCRRCPEPLPEKLQEALLRTKLDAATFTAGEALTNLETMLMPAVLTSFKRAPAFVPHPRIAAKARELGWTTVPTDSGDDGLVRGMEGHFQLTINN
jgi:uroporphyrinogen-III synthase